MTEPTDGLPGLTESSYKPDQVQADTAREIFPVTMFGKTGNPEEEMYDFRPKPASSATPEVEVPKGLSAAEFADLSPEESTTSHPEDPELFVDAEKANGVQMSVPSRPAS
jgi:hypothetical protein